MPWYAKTAAAAIAAYALSPIDLIPDFVPVLGYLDDAVIVSLGIWLVVRLIPENLIAEFREQARRMDKPRSYAGAAAIVLFWAVAAALVLWWLWPHWPG